MILKIHNSPDGKKILALCDGELLGEKFEEGNLQLDLTSAFYKGESKTEEEIIKETIGNFYLNVVGKESVRFCIEKRWIKKENVMTISGIPHAQATIIKEE